MVQMDGVAKFMEDYISNQFWPEKQEIIIQIDIPPPGTTPPPAFLAPNVGSLVI